MAAWRRKALELFPELKQDLTNAEYTIYLLYFDLLPMVREAHEVNNRELVQKIYGFAEWCFDQKAKDLWNAAGVAFYEHLFDFRDDWQKVVPWLSPKVIRGCWPLWEVRLDQNEIDELRALFANRKEHDYRLLT